MKIKLNYIFAVLMVLLLAGTCTAADTDFRIEINDLLTDNQDEQGSNVQVAVSVENVGVEGTQYLECGIYTKEQVESWGYNTRDYLAIFDWWRDIDNVENCKSGETNVDTVKITLDRGQKIPANSLFLVMKAPYTDPNDEYVIFCDAYKACYGSPGFEDIDNRVTDIDMTSFDLQDSGMTATESCSDGILNQDESDTDCGGECEACPLHYKCNTDSDCKSDYCDDGMCLTEPEEEPDDDDYPDNGGDNADTCHEYWWYDNDNPECQKKEFCTIDWHDGLHMFITESQCQASLDNSEDSVFVDWLKNYWMYASAGLILLVGIFLLVIGVFFSRG